MTKNFWRLLCLSALFLVGSCRPLVTTKETKVTDTIYKDRTVTVRDTVFKTAPAKATAAIATTDLNGLKTPIKKQSNNAKITIKTVHDTVYFECLCDTIAIKAQLRDVFEKEYRARSTLTTETQKRELSAFKKFMVSCGYLFWIFAVIGTIYFIKKQK